jgi:hypothetical protein
MAYRVIKFFTDMQDGNHEYKVGDTYPREGVKVSPARIHELSTDENRQNEPLIQEAEELKTEKAVKEVKKAKPKRKAK